MHAYYVVAMSKCGNFITSGSHVKCWVYGKHSNRVSSEHPIRNKFYNKFWIFKENSWSGVDWVLNLETKLWLTINSTFLLLVSKVIVKHTSLRDSSLSSWVETRHSQTCFQCKSVKYNKAIKIVIRFLIMAVSSTSFHEQFDFHLSI